MANEVKGKVRTQIDQQIGRIEINKFKKKKKELKDMRKEPAASISCNAVPLWKVQVSVAMKVRRWYAAATPTEATA